MSNVGQHLLSGALSGFTSTILLQPFDLLKTRLQQGDKLADPRRERSIIKLAREIIVEEGPKGLWRGTVPSLFRNVPGVAMYMTSLSQFRALLASSPYFVSKGPQYQAGGSVLPKLSNHGNLLAGAVTRVAVGFVLNPFSVLKARYESGMFRGQYQTFLSALTSIIRSGPKELFKGFVPSAIRDAPYAGIFVASYEGIKKEASQFPVSSSLLAYVGVHTIAAGSAGAIATVLTHPFDVVKTKVQVRREDRYHGFLRTMGTIWKQRGPLGFFDGVSLRISRKIFSSAIGWAVYEALLMVMYNKA